MSAGSKLTWGPGASEFKGLYLRVNRSVLIQAHRVSEGFPADPALKRPRPAVRPPHVDLQAVRCGENLFGEIYANDNFAKKSALKYIVAISRWKCHDGILITNNTTNFVKVKLSGETNLVTFGALVGSV